MSPSFLTNNYERPFANQNALPQNISILRSPLETKAFGCLSHQGNRAETFRRLTIKSPPLICGFQLVQVLSLSNSNFIACVQPSCGHLKKREAWSQVTTMAHANSAQHLTKRWDFALTACTPYFNNSLKTSLKNLMHVESAFLPSKSLKIPSKTKGKEHGER